MDVWHLIQVDWCAWIQLHLVQLHVPRASEGAHALILKQVVAEAMHTTYMVLRSAVGKT